MINHNKFNIAYRGIAVFAGVLIPVSLILSIQVVFKNERIKEQEKLPIILEMMALQVPQPPLEKFVKKVQFKPKPVKKKSAFKPKLVKQKTPKKTMLAKVKPEIRTIPQSKSIPLKKVQNKILEKIITQQQIEPSLPVPVPIFKLTAVPQFLHKEALVYPEVMRSSGITGIVKLAILIGKEGKVYQVTVIKSAGEAFDEAAKKALLASTFVPAKVGDKKVAVELRMPVKFRLL